jgi:hypothetical protein
MASRTAGSASTPLPLLLFFPSKVGVGSRSGPASFFFRPWVAFGFGPPPRPPVRKTQLAPPQVLFLLVIVIYIKHDTVIINTRKTLEHVKYCKLLRQWPSVITRLPYFQVLSRLLYQPLRWSRALR